MRYSPSFLRFHSVAFPFVWICTVFETWPQYCLYCNGESKKRKHDTTGAKWFNIVQTSFKHWVGAWLYNALHGSHSYLQMAGVFQAFRSLGLE